MSDEPQAPEAIESTTEPTPAVGAEPTTQTTGTIDTLPQWAQDMIAGLRKESAGYRKAKKDAETASEIAARKAAEEQGKFKELYEAETQKRQAAEAETHRLEVEAIKTSVAKATNLPDALAGRLQGETEEELLADAKALAASLPHPGTSLDAAAGTGNTSQTPVMSDEQRQEFAARFGVVGKYVLPENFKLPARR